MSEKLKELKATERELRELVKDVYQTKVSDGTVYLQRFCDFINSNENIKPLLADYDPTEKYDDVLIYYSDSGHITAIVPPKNKTTHISCILGTISFICKRENLHGLFAFYGGHKNYNNSIQNGLHDLLNPLYTLLSGRLRELIDSIDSKEKSPILHIGDNVVGNKQQAGGDIISGDNNTKKIKTTTKTNVNFYKKEGFISGVISGVISTLVVMGIIELIKFLIGM